MTTIGITHTVAALGHGVALTTDTASTPKQLLPEPARGVQILDNASMIYLLQSKRRQLGLGNAEATVRSSTQSRNERIAEQQKQRDAAVEETRKAAESHSLWGTIGDVIGTVAKVAGVVASVALAVCTAGAATPLAALAIAGAVLTTTSFVEEHTHFLEAAGIDPKVAGWINVGLSVGGAVCTGGAGLLAKGVSAVGTVTKVASVAAAATQGGASAVRAIDGLEQSKFKSRAEHDLAAALAAERAAARIQQRLMSFLNGVRRDSDDASRSMANTQHLIETIDATAEAAAT